MSHFSGLSEIRDSIQSIGDHVGHDGSGYLSLWYASTQAVRSVEEQSRCHVEDKVDIDLPSNNNRTQLLA